MAEYENSRIIDFLEKNNSSIDTISKKQLSNLEKVDAEIQKRLESIKHARSIIKSNAINISAIAKATDISNKTFYNNTLLKQFVDSYRENCESKSITEAEYTKLKEQNDDYIQKNKLLMIRDIDLAKQQHEIEELNKEIESLSKRNLTLQEQYNKMLEKCNNSPKVVQFPPQSDNKD